MQSKITTISLHETCSGDYFYLIALREVDLIIKVGMISNLTLLVLTQHSHHNLYVQYKFMSRKLTLTIINLFQATLS